MLRESIITLQIFLYFTSDVTKQLSASDTVWYIEDLYTHPKDGSFLHPWAIWTAPRGLQILFERNKILRRQNLKHYPIRIATPVCECEMYHLIKTIENDLY